MNHFKRLGMGFLAVISTIVIVTTPIFLLVGGITRSINGNHGLIIFDGILVILLFSYYAGSDLYPMSKDTLSEKDDLQ